MLAAPITRNALGQDDITPGPMRISVRLRLSAPVDVSWSYFLQNESQYRGSASGIRAINLRAHDDAAFFETTDTDFDKALEDADLRIRFTNEWYFKEYVHDVARHQQAQAQAQKAAQDAIAALKAKHAGK